jgi:putative transposase
VSQSTSEIRIVPLAGSHDVLTEILRNGAREALARAIEAEVAAWIDDHAHLKDEAGRRQVVRNGSHPERTILTGLGPIAVKQPRVHDRRHPNSARRSLRRSFPPT